MRDASRTPVVLVPGWNMGSRFLGPLYDRFLQAGWKGSDVHAMEFEDRRGSNVAHAHELAEEVQDLAASAGSDAADVVAHSMGGLAIRYLLLHLDSTSVRRVVFLATPHRGTYTAYLARGGGAMEMRPRSEFIRSVGAALPVPTLSLYTPVETYVLPPWFAVMNRARNTPVWCSHRGMVRHSGAFEYVREFLQDPG